jgi:hypothetical protein
MSVTSGPLSVADLLAIWTQAVDESYAQPFLAVGEGNGLEAYTQAFAQYARISTAIDVTTQACFTLPWSGQTNLPASGANLSTVTLTFQRSKRMDQPLILSAGTVFYDEQVNDWSETGSVPVLSGLRYTLQQDLVFQPGDMGPLTAVAQAEKAGYSYNNPLPGAIRVVDQEGTQFTNIDATVLVQVPVAVDPGSMSFFQLQVFNAPDVVIPAHVGQYFQFTSGVNAGPTIYHAIGYVPPNPPANGGTLTFESLVTIVSHFTTGTFVPGEVVQVNGPIIGSIAGYLLYRGGYVLNGNFTATYAVRCGTLGTTDTLQGLTSGATGNVTSILTTPLAGETSDATWVILDWIQDLGLTVTNKQQPTGGTFPMLDGIGIDKNLPRQFGEMDPGYRTRISRIADVVSPNAIRRSLNQTLGAIPWCFREVGYPLLPGFFYDHDFYDYDAVLFTPTLLGFAGFLNGEKVFQTQAGGQVAVGRALNRAEQIAHAGVSTGILNNVFYIPGAAGTTGVPNINEFIGVANIWTTPFVTGLPCIGKVSGTSTTPASLAGGISVIPTNRWRVYLDYLRFRAYFLVSLPRLGAGDFGFFYGAGNGSYGLLNFYDLPGALNDFYDGFPVTVATLYRNVYNAIDKIRASGVYFEFAPADSPCV